MQERKNIAKAASIVSLSTLLSRIAGLVRDQVTAFFFGAGFMADAFFVAWRLPNLLRRLLAEGALTAAFVPVFTETLTKKGAEASAKFFRSILTLMFLILLIITALGIIFAPQIVMLIAPGFTKNAGQFEQAVFLTRLLFPYILMMGLASLFMGALNSLGVFAAPALGPFVANLAMIGGSFFLSSYFNPPITGLALGALVGGILQLAIQLPYLMKAGKYIGFSFKFADPAVKKTLLLMAPAALGAAVYQISVFINTLLASFLPAGSISWLYYADRLMQFPLGIFAVAISTAVLPALSRQNAEGDQAGFLDTARFSLGLSFFITIPAAAGLFALSEPLVEVLFQRGAFDATSVTATAQALSGYVLGLPALSGASMMARLFYSRSDTKTPTKVASFSLLTGAALAFLLMWQMAHVGLALASSLASLLNFIWLYLIFIKKENFPTRLLLKEVGAYILWSILMVAFLWPLRLWAQTLHGPWQLGAVILGICAGAGLYFVMAYFCHCPHIRPILSILRRHKRP